MTTSEQKLIETPNQTATAQAKKEIEKLAEDRKDPKLAESFNALLARKSAQVF